MNIMLIMNSKQKFILKGIDYVNILLWMLQNDFIIEIIFLKIVVIILA